jgi:His-Xaa-Ser system radical SAM maturase HxsB
VLVPAARFDDLVGGRLAHDDPLWQTLRDGGFIPGELDEDAAVVRYRRRHAHVGHAPYLHIVVLTLRCNEACAYCHASRAPMSARGVDMTPPVARQVVQRVFESESSQLAIEFQGGEPLANLDMLRFVVEVAQERNADEGRELQLLLVSNLSLLDEPTLQWLLDHEVLICTSLDGPRDLHDGIRKLRGGSAYDHTVRWIERIGEAYRERGRDPRLWHVDALLTTTRQHFGRAREVVDEYVRHGLHTIHVRPLNRMGFAAKTWERIGYTPEEFVAFWRQCLDYIIELNLGGVELIERGAALYLASILTDDHHGYVDLRSPCGAGVGQVAYDPSGQVFPCDEARMVARMGDDLFALGDVSTLSMDDVVRHETVRAMGIASCLEALPGCRFCAYMPYCGVCPVVDYMASGDLFGHRPTSDRCRVNLLALDHVFDILGTERPGVREILRRWTVQRPRTVEPGNREP